MTGPSILSEGVAILLSALFLDLLCVIKETKLRTLKNTPNGVEIFLDS
jgi:hypothetical protein